MKKLISLFLVLIILCSVMLSGCDKITKDTNPNDIVSSIVTEKQWNEAFAYIGMKNRFYELANNIDLPVIKKLSVFISQEDEDGKYSWLLGFDTVKKENMLWACNLEINLYFNGQKIEEKSGKIEIGERLRPELRYETHAYYFLSNELISMDNVVTDFNNYEYNQEKGAYCRTFFDEIREEQKEIKLKFKGNRIVCYQEFSADSNTYILFYNYK